MKGIRLKSKEDVGSIVIIMMVLFLMFVIGMVFITMWNPIKEELLNTPEINAQNQSVDAIGKVDDATKLMDIFIVVSFIALIIGLIVSSIYIEVHPVYMVGFLLLIILAVFIASQLANVTYEFEQYEEFEKASETFSISRLLFGKLFPLWILIAGAITIVILYGKGQGTV